MFVIISLPIYLYSLDTEMTEPSLYIFLYLWESSRLKLQTATASAFCNYILKQPLHCATLVDEMLFLLNNENNISLQYYTVQP